MSGLDDPSGVVVLAFRRTTVPRVRATTSPVDRVALLLLAVVIVLGVVPTIGINLVGSGLSCRSSVRTAKGEWS